MDGNDGDGDVTPERQTVETTDEDRNLQTSTNNSTDSINSINSINTGTGSPSNSKNNSNNNNNSTPTRSPSKRIIVAANVADASEAEAADAATRTAVRDMSQETNRNDPNQTTTNKNLPSASTSPSATSLSSPSKRIAPSSRVASTPKSAVSSTDFNTTQGTLPVLIAPRESRGNPPPHATPPHTTPSLQSRYHHHHPYSPPPMHYYHYAGHPPPPHTPSYYAYPYASHPPTAQQPQQPLQSSSLSPSHTGTATSSLLTKSSTATAPASATSNSTTADNAKENAPQSLTQEESPRFPANESMSATNVTAMATVTSTPPRKPFNNATSAPSLTVASPSPSGGNAPSPNRATPEATTPLLSGHHHHHYYYPGSSTPASVPPHTGGAPSPCSAWPPPHSGAYHHHPYPPAPHHPAMLPPPAHITATTTPAAATVSSYLHPPPHPSHLYQPPPLHGSAPDAAWKGNATPVSSPAAAPSTPPPTSAAPPPAAPHAPPHSSHPSYMWPPPHLAHPPHALHPYAYHVPPYARQMQAPPPLPTSTTNSTIASSPSSHQQQPPVSISQGGRYQRPTTSSTTSLSPSKQQQQTTPPNGTADKSVALAPREPSGTIPLSTVTIAPSNNESSSTSTTGPVENKLPNDYITIANRMRVPPRSKMDDAREGATSPSEIETHHRDEVQDMGCTCKKTRCLKLYCQCFGFKLYCGPNCRCLLCFNTIQHEKQRKLAINTILSRNPLAFDAKFKKDAPLPLQPITGAGVTGAPIAPSESADSTSTASGTTAVASSAKGDNTSNESTGTGAGEAMSATAVDSIATEANRILTHRLGCKCRRSACMKKYCECYAGNVKCSSSCRCIGCKNMGSTADFRATTKTAIGNSIRASSTTSAAPMTMTAAAANHHATATMYPYPPPPHHHHLHQYAYPYPHIAPHPHYPHMHQYPYMMPPPQHVAPPQAQPHASSHHAPIQSEPLQSQAPPPRDSSGSDSWIAAAQSLAFLKQSSPAGEHKRLDNFSMGVSPISKSRGGNSKGPVLVTKGTDRAKAPSLASSSEGNVRDDDPVSVFHHLPFESTPESTRSKRATAASGSSHSGDGEDDSALLMAAVAMTEFGQSPPPLSSMLSPDKSMIRRSSPRDDEMTPDNFAVRDEDKSSPNIGEPSSPISAKRRSTRTTRGKGATKRDLNFDEVMSTPRRKRKPKYLDD